MSPSLTTCPDPQRLHQLKAGLLPADESDAVHEHLRACPVCRQRWHDLQAEGDPFAQALNATRLDVLHSAESAPDAGPPARAEAFSFLGPPRGGPELGWLGPYRVLRLLGRGGMGVVFEAEDTHLHRTVALKVLKPELAADATERQRFLQEARVAASLPPEHIATIYQVAEENGVPLIVMQYLQGESLEARLLRPLPWAEAGDVARQAAEGLAVIHARGLVHRDLKPGNVWLEGKATEDTENTEKEEKPVPSSSVPSVSSVAPFRVKLLDFGLARSSGGNLALTHPGMIVGTPHYMSPEQARGEPLDGRSDLFSLGTVLYQMLTRTLPFDGRDVMAVLTALAVDTPPPPERKNPDVPLALSRLVMHMLAKKPGDRPADAREVIARLRAVMPVGRGGYSLPRDSSDGAPRPPAPPAHDVPHAPPEDPSLSAAWHTPPAIFPGRLPRFSLPVALGVLAVALTTIAVLLFGYHRHHQAPPPDNSGKGLPPPAKTEPIKVGLLYSFNGPMAQSESPVGDATVLAIEQVNLRGGILGRQVEYYIEDGASDAEAFARKAEKLLNQDQVYAVFGGGTSDCRKLIKPIVERLDGLLVYPFSFEGLELSPRAVYMGAVPNQQVLPAVDHAVDVLGAKKFFLVGSDHVFPRAANAIIRDALKARPGVEVVGEHYLPLGGKDVEGILAAVREKQPDVILNSLNGSSNVFFFRGLRRAGLTPQRLPTISFVLGETELLSLDTQTMAGDYVSDNYFQSVAAPENERFVRDFRARFGADRVLSDPMESAYSGVFLWAAAVRTAGTEEAGPVREALRGRTFASPGGPRRIDADTLHSWQVARVGKIRPDGQLDIVYATPEPVPPVPFPPFRGRRGWELFLNDLYLDWGHRWSAPPRP
jgi:urea transport system substrate-binding protein